MVSEAKTYGAIANISFLAELIPTSALKFSKKILAYLTSRDTVDKIYPLCKHPKNLCDIFEIHLGINSPPFFLAKARRGAHLKEG